MFEFSFDLILVIKISLLWNEQKSRSESGNIYLPIEENFLKNGDEKLGFTLKESL